MAFQIKQVGVTAAGAIGGALAAGPIGALIGAAGGAAVDWWRARTPKGLAPHEAAALAVRADKTAGTKAVNLMLSAASSGPHITGASGQAVDSSGVMARAAAVFLKQFQASVQLPQTGQLDATTRSMLTAAIPSAANLPATTILG